MKSRRMIVARPAGASRPGRLLLVCSLAPGLVFFFLAGCTPAPRTGPAGVVPDLPLLLGRNERVTEMLDGTVVGSGIIAVGELGTILRSDDYGSTWQKSVITGAANLNAVSFAPDNQHGWAVGDETQLLATTDGGQTWTIQSAASVASPINLLDVLVLDARHVIAVGTGGAALETLDGGDTWARRLLVTGDSRFNRLSRGASGTLYLAGEHGAALRSYDSGATWERLPVPTEKMLYGILPINERVLLAYGANMSGHVFRSVDDGRSWSIISLEKHTLRRTAMMTSNGRILLDDRFVSRDAGRSFQPWAARPETLNLIEMIQAPNGSFVIFGIDGATVVADR
ncbi:MAG: glycosyl hydrolase, repeat [Verrucomicrobia bacterium]|nr:glycosyl hydrolase, repeat [Verrucomicrobiota bacterium]